MTDKTINALTATTTAVGADEIPMWVAGSGVTRKITRENFLSGYAAIINGTWTPLLIGDVTAGTQTYNTKTGRYVRIGSLVVARFYVRLYTISGAVGNTLIGGLPFAAQNNSSDYSASVISFWTALGTAYVTLTVYTVPGQSYAIVRGATAAATGLSALPVSAWTTNTELMGVLIYEM